MRSAYYHRMSEKTAYIDQAIAQLARATGTSVTEARLLEWITAELNSMNEAGQRWLEEFHREALPGLVDHELIGWLEEIKQVV